MGLLRKLRELVENLDPEQVKKLMDLIRTLTGVFGAQGFQAKGAAPTDEENEAVDALKAKGVDESEARRVVKSLNG